MTKYVKPEVLVTEFTYENIATGGGVEIPDLPPMDDSAALN